MARAKKSEQQIAVHEPEATSLLAVIAQAVKDPAVDVSKMERLLAMQQQVEDRHAERAFNTALSLAQEEMPRVVRDRANPSTKSKYATLESVNTTIMPVVFKHGFSPSFGTEDSPIEGHFRIVCHLSHTGGYTRKYQIDLPADGVGPKGERNKTPTHAVGSTMSYGRRYLLLMIFNIALANEDDDGNKADAGPRIDEAEVQTIRELLQSTGAPEASFLKFMKVEAIEAIAHSKYEDAIGAIKDWVKRRQKGS